MAEIGDLIKEELENFGLDAPEDDVMNKLTGLCSSLAIKPSDIADQWMAFSVNNRLVPSWHLGCCQDHMYKYRLIKC